LSFVVHKHCKWQELGENPWNKLAIQKHANNNQDLQHPTRPDTQPVYPGGVCVLLLSGQPLLFAFGWGTEDKLVINILSLGLDGRPKLALFLQL